MLEVPGGTADDENQGDEDDKDHACSTCGAPIGIFTGFAGWPHFRGDGTADSPVELYDAGHEATFALGPGGAR